MNGNTSTLFNYFCPPPFKCIRVHESWEGGLQAHIILVQGSTVHVKLILDTQSDCSVMDDQCCVVSLLYLGPPHTPYSICVPSKLWSNIWILDCCHNIRSRALLLASWAFWGGSLQLKFDMVKVTSTNIVLKMCVLAKITSRSWDHILVT